MKRRDDKPVRIHIIVPQSEVKAIDSEAEKLSEHLQMKVSRTDVIRMLCRDGIKFNESKKDPR